MSTYLSEFELANRRPPELPPHVRRRRWWLGGTALVMTGVVVTGWWGAIDVPATTGVVTFECTSAGTVHLTDAGQSWSDTTTAGRTGSFRVRSGTYDFVTSVGSHPVTVRAGAVTPMGPVACGATPPSG